jgi:carbon monoxide dehydrogenase subunit G
MERPRSRSRGLFFRASIDDDRRLATHTITFQLGEAPERVFDYIADIRNEADWSPDIRSVTKRGDGPVGDGTIFDTNYRLFGPMEIELREYRRPEHLVFDGEGPRMRMHFVMDVAPQGAGSQVTFFIDMRPRGILVPLAPLLKLGLPHEMAKRPEQFRAALATS